MKLLKLYNIVLILSVGTKHFKYFFIFTQTQKITVLQQLLQLQLQPQQPLLRQVGPLPVSAVNNSIYQTSPPCSLWADGRMGVPAPRWKSSPPAPESRLITASSSLCPRGGTHTPSARALSVGETPPVPSPTALRCSKTEHGRSFL